MQSAIIIFAILLSVVLTIDRLYKEHQRDKLKISQLEKENKAVKKKGKVDKYEYYDKLTHKRCTKCGKNLPLTEFGNHCRRVDGKNDICKTCKSIYNKYYHAKKKREKKNNTLQLTFNKRM